MPAATSCRRSPHLEVMPLIVVYLKRGGSIEIPHAAAVAASIFPAAPGNQPAQAINIVTAAGAVLASFRQCEIAGYTIVNAGA
jgi:hypothetical protein